MTIPSPEDLNSLFQLHEFARSHGAMFSNLQAHVMETLQKVDHELGQQRQKEAEQRDAEARRKVAAVFKPVAPAEAQPKLPVTPPVSPEAHPTDATSPDYRRL